MKPNLKLWLLTLLLGPGLLLARENCPFPSTIEMLSGNNIKTWITTNGSNFYNPDEDAGFIVSSPDGQERATIFAQSIWMGGIDMEGNLKFTSNAYEPISSSSSDYAPGPLDPTTGITDPETCNDWDQIWKINRYEIETHILDYEDNSVIDQAISTILGWPGRNNPNFFDQYGFELPENTDLAPFFDRDADGNYEPLDGDYPKLSNTDRIPEQMTWSVINDTGDDYYTPSLADPLQMEIQLTTWAFQCSDNEELNNTLFTSYKLINRGAVPLDSTFFGIWADFDLGDYFDDYVGCSPEQNTFFAYNATNQDLVFGENPPVMAVKLLNRSLDKFIYIHGTSITGIPSQTTDPNGTNQRLNLLSGKWRDGSPLTYGGNGFGGDTPTDFAFPDNPNDTTGWSMTTADMPLVDRRGMGILKIDTLQPESIHFIDLAYTYVREEGADHLENVTEMYTAVDAIQEAYDSGFTETCAQFEICQSDCVWPGDANADGIANHCDLFPVVFAIGETGPNRVASNNWAPYFSDNWIANSVGDVNLKHADGNADGIIQEADIMITEQNYGSTIPGYQAPSDSYTEGSELFFRPVPINANLEEVNPGNFFFLQVRLSEDIQNIRGLSFSLNYDPTYFQPFQYQVFPASNNEYAVLFNPVEDARAIGQIDYAEAGLLPENLIPSGSLIIIRLQTWPTFDEPLPSASTQIRLKNIKAFDAAGNIVEIGSTNQQVTLVDVPVSTEEQFGVRFSVFPNPTSGDLNLQLPTDGIRALQITDLSGKIWLRRKTNLSGLIHLDMSNLSSGMYFLHIQDQEQTYIKKVVLDNN